MSTAAITLEFSPDGSEVRASIDASKSRGIPVVADQVLMALEEAGANEFQIEYQAIERLVQSQNAGPRPLAVAHKVDGKVEVSFGRNKMEASVTLFPAKGGRSVEVEDVIGALARAGVNSGIKHDVIENIVMQQWYNEKVVVAEGKEAVNGSNGKVTFLFEQPDDAPRPQIDEEGQVNFHELNIITNIRANDPLAEKLPPTLGENGFNVLGEEIPAKPGKDVPFPIGKGVTFSKENPNLIVAQIAGQPRIMQGKIHVFPVFEVKGDVDFSTGNINFVGEVIIRGAILEGFVVKADANITVFGPVSGCVLESGGNVILHKGMHGQDKGIIVAGEDVVAKFLEHTTVKAGGSVRATDGIIQCNVTAKKSVSVDGKKGVIIGGRVSAGEEIRAKTVGNALATPTEVEAGGSPKVRDELRQIEDQKKAFKLNLDRTEKGVKSLKLIQERQGGLPPDKKDLLLQLTRAQFHLMGQLRKLEQREQELEEILASSYKGKIVVSESIHPGVKVIIKQAVLHVRDTINSTVFFEQDGEIQIGVFG